MQIFYTPYMQESIFDKEPTYFYNNNRILSFFPSHFFAFIEFGPKLH
jgi:hypothetical protein